MTIQEAADWLSSIDPDWKSKVDTYQLDMSDVRNCVLGQVFANRVEYDTQGGWTWAQDNLEIPNKLNKFFDVDDYILDWIIMIDGADNTNSYNAGDTVDITVRAVVIHPVSKGGYARFLLEGQRVNANPIAVKVIRNSAQAGDIRLFDMFSCNPVHAQFDGTNWLQAGGEAIEFTDVENYRDVIRNGKLVSN